MKPVQNTKFIYHNEKGYLTGLSIGANISEVLSYVSPKRRQEFEDKSVRGSNFVMKVGENGLVWVKNRIVTSIKVFAGGSNERELFLRKLSPVEVEPSIGVTLHAVERLADRFEYAKGYSIDGLFNTIIRLVKRSKLSFKTTGGKELRRCGKHMFVVFENTVVTMIEVRPEFLIYEAAFHRSQTAMPDILVSKYVQEKTGLVLNKNSF